MFFSRRHPMLRRSPCGFTLVELLVVMGIIVLLLAFTVPALEDHQTARQLTVTGDRLSALIERARQNAISRNSLTMLLLPLDGPAARRSAILLERQVRDDNLLPDPTDWKVIANWSTFPEGIAIDDTNATRLADQTASLTPQLPRIQQRGVTLNRYHLVGFLPDGSILPLGNIGQPKLRLTEAIQVGTDLRYTRDRGSANLYDMIFLPANGRVKIYRH